MGETKFDRVRFGKLVQDIEKDEIVLPDFQRGFVWKDKDKQKALLASVLTKLPIGTILLLEIETDKYACKKIGLKNEKPDLSKVEEKVKALLDGQQRVTVLTAFFSNELFVIGKDAEFVAPSLKRRYFLQIPKLKFNNAKRDLFGAKSLIVSDKIKMKAYPEYSTEEIIDCITHFEYPKYKSILYGDIDNVPVNDLIHFCTNNNEDTECYLIPLYYLYGASTKSNTAQRYRLKKVIERIAELYHNEILEELKRNEDADSELIQIVFEETEDGNAAAISLKEDIQKGIFTIKDEESDLYKYVDELLKNRRSQWAEDIREFLESCVEGLELYKIEVPQSDILRAIDIYQNLNLGGKSLDIFDLILARAATQSENENLLQVVKKCILENHKDDYEIFKNNCEGQIVNEYEEFVNSRDEYSASSYLGGWDVKADELSTTFCKTLMSTVGTLDFFMDKKSNMTLTNLKRITEFSNKVTKSEYLLKIDAERIDILVRKACKGMDRACFFLQMRCGIREITEIQYKLIFVILSVILSEDKWFYNKKICNYLEAWYWSAIFSGAFRSEQNAAFQDNLKALLRIIAMQESEEGSKPDYIIQLCNGVFCDEKFANEDILLVNNEFIDPSDTLTNTICQYYLSRTYSDILRKDVKLENYEKKQISVFTEYKDKSKLQKHHIVPIGELSAQYKAAEQEYNKRRKDKRNVYNSPLNFAYISAKANKTILNNPLSYYAEYCDNGTLTTLGIDTSNNGKVSSNDTELRGFLHKRYSQLCANLRAMFSKNLKLSETDFEDFYLKSKSKDY